MARNRKAVRAGSTRKQPARGRNSGSTDAAQATPLRESSGAMSSTNTKPKRNPRRAAKDRWEEHTLMTSANSQLVDLDLVKLLSKPEAWNCLDEDEKQEILKLLPEDVHPNPYVPADDPDAKIPPLPESFLRYSNNWRDGIRQYQLDLQNGRYDPEWIQQAEEARQQRAEGKFDKFKAEEFEQFWGQKQKLDYRIAAGESSSVRLATLVEHGLVREGDIWKYSRSLSKGKVLVEKEARIVNIDGTRLTFAVPPGQRVFLPVAQAPTTEKTLEKSGASQSDALSTDSPEIMETTEADLGIEQAVHGNNKDTEETRSTRSSESTRSRKRARTAESPESSIFSSSDLEPEPYKSPPPTQNLAVEIHNKSMISNTEDTLAFEEAAPTGSAACDGDRKMDDTDVTTDVASARENEEPKAPEDNDEDVKEVIIPDIQGPGPLGLKIIQMDGRVKNIPNGNAWKEFRCYRDNQDMGTLWEIRQAWFLKQT